jgi:DNA polymerase-3 subunit epsilon
VAERSSAAVRAYLEASLPTADTPWREADFTVIDLETTGLDPSSDEIISFATVTVSGGRVSLADARYELVRPRRMPGEETIRIHGLRETDLEGAPPFSQVLDGLLETLTGRAIVAHVAAVERSFLTAALAEHRLPLRNQAVDTAALAAELGTHRRDPSLRAHPIGLSDLGQELGLPVHRPHHADGDALTTAQAFIALATHLDEIKPQTLGSLQKLGPRPGLVTRVRQRLRRTSAADGTGIRSSARP